MWHKFLLICHGQNLRSLRNRSHAGVDIKPLLMQWGKCCHRVEIFETRYLLLFQIRREHMLRFHPSQNAQKRYLHNLLTAFSKSFFYARCPYTWICIQTKNCPVFENTTTLASTLQRLLLSWWNKEGWNHWDRASFSKYSLIPVKMPRSDVWCDPFNKGLGMMRPSMKNFAHTYSG